MLLVSILGLFHLFPRPVSAGETEDFRFARKLQSDGMFVAAAEEFLRFAERYPYSTLRDEALIGAGETYMQAGKAALALDIFERFLEAYAGDEKACKARFYRGRIFKALSRYREAAVEFLRVLDESGDCALVDESLLEGGECLLSAGESEEAAGVFKRLISQYGQSDLVPRATYSLALALVNTGRDLGAEKVLEDLVSQFPASPVAALALVKLGEWALSRGDTDRAEMHFQRVVDRYKEKTLQEKGMFNLIEIYARRENDRDILEASERYLDRFPEAERRGDVFTRAIDAAWNLGRYDRALEMVDTCLAHGAVQDTMGVLALYRGKILARTGRRDDALGVLSSFRRTYPASPRMREGLVLEAELRAEGGAPREAARLYHLALLEANSGMDDVTILAHLAELSVRDLADTVSAIRYWEMIVGEDRDGEMAEEALWRSSEARQRIGDAGGARTGYETLVERFPGGRFSEEAGRRLAYLAAVPRWDEATARALARTAVSDAPEAVRRVRTAVTLLEGAGDPEGAARILDRALEMQLPDTLAAEARYYLGKTHARLYERSTARGEPDSNARARAMSMWWDIARDFVGTTYGMRAHRDYLEYKLSELKPRAKLAKLDEFSKLYGGGPAGRWAAGIKIDVLYGMARDGEQWAADSARVLCAELLQADPSGPEGKEALLKYGYLNRMGGDLEATSRSFEEFVGRYGDDRRAAPVLYDLGETLLELKRYDEAAAAYSRCLEKVPNRSLAEKCALRIGDCHYFRRRFDQAARTYIEFTARYPGSNRADEVAYREALALEQAGEIARADSILTRIVEKENIDRGLRVRLLRKLGQRLHEKGESGEARPLVEELVTLERSTDNLKLLGDVLSAVGEYESAISAYSAALKFADADTCGILGSRARVRFHNDDFKRAHEDLASLLGSCPDHRAVPAVYLEQGSVEVERGRCGEAEATLQALREKYPGTDAATRALYHLAVCDMKRGGYEEAIAKLNTFAQTSPQSPIIDQVYFKLASAQFGAGNLHLAAENYTLAAEASRDAGLRFGALKNVATVYQELEEYDKAAQAWRRVTELFPEGEGIIEIFFNRGFCYGQAGRYEMAYEVYSRIPGIAENEEQQGRAHYWSGISLKNLGRCGEAVREFLRVPYLRTGGMWGVTAKLEAAACYEEIDELDQARDIYNDVISSHGAGSDWGRVAKEALDRLEGARDRKGSGGKSGTDGGSPRENGRGGGGGSPGGAAPREVGTENGHGT